MLQQETLPLEIGCPAPTCNSHHVAKLHPSYDMLGSALRATYELFFLGMLPYELFLRLNW